jgi:hypothetical protein
MIDKIIKKSIKRSCNINEIIAIIESNYKGPNPELFIKTLLSEISQLYSINEVRNYSLILLDKISELSPKLLKKLI